MRTLRSRGSSTNSGAAWPVRGPTPNCSTRSSRAGTKPRSRNAKPFNRSRCSGKLAAEDFVPTAITYPHIVAAPGDSAHLENHPRMRVAMIVMDYLARGLGPEDLAGHHPYLTLAEVHSAMA